MHSCEWYARRTGMTFAPWPARLLSFAIVNLYEREYLQQENGLRQVAAIELVAFYQLAKAVEMLGIFVGKGTPEYSVG